MDSFEYPATAGVDRKVQMLEQRIIALEQQVASLVRMDAERAERARLQGASQGLNQPQGFYFPGAPLAMRSPF